jgi:hypothetical protein
LARKKTAAKSGSKKTAAGKKAGAKKTPAKAGNKKAAAKAGKKSTAGKKAGAKKTPAKSASKKTATKTGNTKTTAKSGEKKAAAKSGGSCRFGRRDEDGACALPGAGDKKDDKKPPPTEEKTASYQKLEKAAGSRTLQDGQRYMMKEKSPGLLKHHKVIDGTVTHTEDKAKNTLTKDFANTEYHHLTYDEDANGKQVSSVTHGAWDGNRPSKSSYSFKGKVKQAYNFQKAGDAFLKNKGTDYNLLANIPCTSGENCQTYASHAVKDAKEKRALIRALKARGLL